ncbi:hypothetical protein B0G77_2428 [Paraburkholderia sp. BL10I2N1]|nr:hypothetical protein B0G77_2428 [Paraburkholderia sp. BL10I2N1]
MLAGRPGWGQQPGQGNSASASRRPAWRALLIESDARAVAEPGAKRDA